MLFVLALCSVALAKSATCAAHKNILLEPGLMSSILESYVDVSDNYKPWVDGCERRKAWFRSWMMVKDALPWTNECQMSYLHGVWNKQTNKLEDIPGIKTRVPKFGSTYAVDTLCPVILAKRFTQSFHGIIEHYEKMGYKDGVDLMAAPYDWRSNDLSDEYYEQTKLLIEEAFKRNGQKTVIVSHSMGGFVTYKLLDYLGQEFCDKYIDSWVALSAPFIGTGMAVKMLLVGENAGLPINEKLAMSLGRSIQSIVSLLPNENKWNSDDVLIEIKSTGKQYKIKDLRSFMKQVPELSDKTDYILDNSIEKYYKKYNYTVPFHVKMHCGYSLGTETPKKVIFDTEDITGGYTVEYTDGDKLVNEESLKSCSMFTDDVKYLGKVKHVKILKSEDTYNYLDGFICN